MQDKIWYTPPPIEYRPGQYLIDFSLNERAIEFWHQRGIRTRVIIQRVIVTRGSKFNVESWFGVTTQRVIMTRGHNSMWTRNPGSHSNIESWIQREIITQGYNSTGNHDPGVTIQRELWIFLSAKIQKHTDRSGEQGNPVAKAKIHAIGS